MRGGSQPVLASLAADRDEADVTEEVDFTARSDKKTCIKFASLMHRRHKTYTGQLFGINYATLQQMSVASGVPEPEGSVR